MQHQEKINEPFQNIFLLLAIFLSLILMLKYLNNFYYFLISYYWLIECVDIKYILHTNYLTPYFTRNFILSHKIQTHNTLSYNTQSYLTLPYNTLSHNTLSHLLFKETPNHFIVNIITNSTGIKNRKAGIRNEYSQKIRFPLSNSTYRILNMVGIAFYIAFGLISYSCIICYTYGCL